MNTAYKPGDVHRYFTEVNIIAQLSTTLVGKILPDGVHPSHFAIVIHLVRMGDGQTPMRIAGAMQVSKATMSHSLAVLEKRGFIETRPCEVDARSKQVFLTEAGHAFHLEAIDRAARTFTAFLGDDERQAMTDALPGLIEIRKLLDDNRNPFFKDERR